jgi:hypothetical protein
MSPGRATSVEETLEWVRPVLCEGGGLRPCPKPEPAGLGRSRAVLESLKEGITALRGPMRKGVCRFGRGAPPVTGPAPRCAGETPFPSRREPLNETHRRGLDVDGED